MALDLYVDIFIYLLGLLPSKSHENIRWVHGCVLTLPPSCHGRHFQYYLHIKRLLIRIRNNRRVIPENMNPYTSKRRGKSR